MGTSESLFPWGKEYELLKTAITIHRIQTKSRVKPLSNQTVSTWETKDIRSWFVIPSRIIFTTRNHREAEQNCPNHKNKETVSSEGKTTFSSCLLSTSHNGGKPWASWLERQRKSNLSGLVNSLSVHLP